MPQCDKNWYRHIITRKIAIFTNTPKFDEYSIIDHVCGNSSISINYYSLCSFNYRNQKKNYGSVLWLKWSLSRLLSKKFLLNMKMTAVGIISFNSLSHMILFLFLNNHHTI